MICVHGSWIYIIHCRSFSIRTSKGNRGRGYLGISSELYPRVAFLEPSGRGIPGLDS